MKIIGIFAHSVNGYFGVNGTLPWPHKIKEDMKHFKTVTMGHPIIMGMGTWKSFNEKPLPGRLNIVVSSSFADKPNTPWEPDGVRCFKCFNDAIDYLTANEYKECYVIGGGRLFDRVYQYIDEWMVTVVDYMVMPGNDVPVREYDMNWTILRPGMIKTSERFLPIQNNPDNIQWLAFETYSYDAERDYSKKLSFWAKLKNLFK